MSTLGDRLRGQEAERKRLGRLAVAERERLFAERFLQRAQQVRGKLIDAKVEVLAAIEANRTVKPVEVEKVEPFWFSGVNLNEPAHPYHDIWVELETWGAENGLDLTIRYNHDGGGLRDWHEIMFKPKATSA
jgi:hypothetical protein